MDERSFDKSAVVIPNLAKLGVKQADWPDLITPYKTAYPMVGNYKSLCGLMGVKAFAGGAGYDKVSKRFYQGTGLGQIVCGYVDRRGSHSANSAHFYAAAWDINLLMKNETRKAMIGTKGFIERQFKWIKTAISNGLFLRGGFYLASSIIHLDLCNDLWERTYGGTQFWVNWKDAKGKSIYTGYRELNAAYSFAMLKAA